MRPIESLNGKKSNYKDVLEGKKRRKAKKQADPDTFRLLSSAQGAERPPNAAVYLETLDKSTETGRTPQSPDWAVQGSGPGRLRGAECVCWCDMGESTGSPKKCRGAKRLETLWADVERQVGLCDSGFAVVRKRRKIKWEGPRMPAGMEED